jgi:hypothetical protein
MHESLQLDLFGKTLDQQFALWIDSAQGRDVSARFIRIAMACRQRGVKVGAKAIWERLRWHYETRREAGAGGNYELNNNWTAYMARFAEAREPMLQGFFEFRKLVSGGNRRASRAVVIPIQTRREA